MIDAITLLLVLIIAITAYGCGSSIGRRSESKRADGWMKAAYVQESERLKAYDDAFAANECLEQALVERDAWKRRAGETHDLLAQAQDRACSAHDDKVSAERDLRACRTTLADARAKLGRAHDRVDALQASNFRLAELADDRGRDIDKLSAELADARQPMAWGFPLSFWGLGSNG